MTLPGYEGELRQLTVMELGHEEPTVLLTNHRKLGPVELVTRYAQRMLIENGISEAVQFFHINALSSMVGMKVDFDMQLTLAASSLYRIMAQRIGREYIHSQAKTLFRNLLDLSGKVEVTTTSVVVTILRWVTAFALSCGVPTLLAGSMVAAYEPAESATNSARNDVILAKVSRLRMAPPSNR